MSGTRRWAPSAVWAACIVVATSVPGSALPTVATFPGADKVVHATMYGILGVLAGRATLPRTGAALFLPLAAIASLAAADEVHQMWIPGRSADVRDWMADAAGAAVGLTYSYMARSRRERRT